MHLSGSVRYRPVRIGFLVPPDDLSSIIRAARLSACLWGGRYNPIIPFLDAHHERWHRHHRDTDGAEVTRGFIDFFEPDTLVESRLGMATEIGWTGSDHYLQIPRAKHFDDFFKMDHRGDAQFFSGIDIENVIAELYDTEFRFERRHKQLFSNISEAPGDAFFDVVGGRYPTDAPLQYIQQEYDDVFEPELLPADSTTALRQMKEGIRGPLWVTRHALDERPGRGPNDNTFYVFNPKDAGDVIDYWNFRLTQQNVYPINVHWIDNFSQLMRDAINDYHRPIPGNSFGTKFISNICFASSIDDQRLTELVAKHLSGVSPEAFSVSRDPLFWSRQRQPFGQHTSKLLAAGPSSSFDVELDQNATARIPALSPTFLNRSKRYMRSQWVNVLTPRISFRGDPPAIAYPSNLWAPGFPRIGSLGPIRVGREGWIIPQEYSAQESSLNLQTGRDAIVGWLDANGIEAKPSEEGQIAAQVITTAGGLWPCAMFAHPETLELLNDMAESRDAVNRNGNKVTKATADRSRPTARVENHFNKRAKDSVSLWSRLDYFLERSVFRAGVRVRCPICGYQNWIDLDTLSYRPTCTRCRNSFQLSQKPDDLRKVEWHYRIIGPFTAPDFARGAYSVALTLRTLSVDFDTEITWSTGLELPGLGCEVDFVAWHRPRRILDDENEEPLLVIGEAKSFGHNAITEDAISALQTVAQRFPGSIMVVSVLREGKELCLAEIGRLRRLAIWGRRSSFEGQPINPLIVLTGAELFSLHGIASAWKKADGRAVRAAHDLNNLHTLSELTLSRYVGLGPYWDLSAQSRALPAPDGLLKLLRTHGSSPHQGHP